MDKDLAKKVSLSLHKSFCLNRESKVKGLANQVKNLHEQREWMRAYEQLKAWEKIVISFDDEEELARQIAMSSVSGPSTSKTRGRNWRVCSEIGSRVVSGGKKKGLECELR